MLPVLSVRQPIERQSVDRKTDLNDRQPIDAQTTDRLSVPYCLGLASELR